VALFDPDDERLLAPGDMPARIEALCTETGQSPPEGPGEFVRSVLQSLACKYRLVLERLELATGVDVEVIHVIGGGARNQLLCRLTAQQLGRPVLAGPVEATALGNVLMQARATGELGSRTEMREVLAGLEPVSYEPSPDHGQADDRYGRFLTVTGLASPRIERAVAGSA
jgi:rhamnulokinase